MHVSFLNYRDVAIAAPHIDMAIRQPYRCADRCGVVKWDKCIAKHRGSGVGVEGWGVGVEVWGFPFFYRTRKNDRTRKKYITKSGSARKAGASYPLSSTSAAVGTVGRTRMLVAVETSS